MATAPQIQKPFVRDPYNYDRDLASVQSGVEFPNPSKTQQQFREEADINEIVRRFGITGQLPENYRAPQFGDFTGITDYQTALNQVLEADAAFMQMPAELRARFNNDPQQLMAFLADANNREEAIKLGLVPKPPENPGNTPAAPPGASPA